jgi:hypothetical protein
LLILSHLLSSLARIVPHALNSLGDNSTATMYFSLISLLALAAAAAASKAIDIAVGMNGALTFMPNSTTADVGDM